MLTTTGDFRLEVKLSNLNKISNAEKLNCIFQFAILKSSFIVILFFYMAQAKTVTTKKKMIKKFTVYCSTIYSDFSISFNTH